jgi:peptidoglycan/LPS O-acetylase OafA/YrhL
MGLGFIRFVLAMMVLLNHLWLPTANTIGAHAVTGFYIVSGFLMTKVINEVYLGDKGRLRYLINRVLRIYPLYLLILTVTLICVFIFPEYFKVYSLIRLPTNANEWFSNLTLFRLTDSATILIPPAWSLYVEVVFYMIIAFIGRSQMVIFLWFIISVFYTVWMVENNYSFGDRYYPLTAASLFFSAGAVIYFIIDKNRSTIYLDKIPKKVIFIIFALFIVFPLLVGSWGGGRHWLGYYGASAIFLFLFSVLVAKKQLKGSHYDDYMGDLAYPIFLTHFFAEGLVNLITLNKFVINGHIHFLLSTFACLLISIGYLKWMEPLIERLRSRMRFREVKS